MRMSQRDHRHIEIPRNVTPESWIASGNCNKTAIVVVGDIRCLLAEKIAKLKDFWIIYTTNEY